MELDVWKMILLKWVNDCNFIENVSSLEDSHIEAFYAAYSQNAQVEPQTEQYPSPLNLTFSLGPLLLFLRDIYPDFEPNLNCDGRVVTADYVYVYTLLMHYTCVQNPSKYFHNICENLPETVQQFIAAFFQQTVKRPKLTRNRLHQLILNVRCDVENSFLVSVPLIVTDSKPTECLNFNRSGSYSLPIISLHGSNNGLNCFSDSQIKDSTTNDTEASVNTNSVSQKLVQQKPNTQSDRPIFTPLTPKTELLEQQTRELLGLRAQLETERYEKTVLEEQILENEHLIKSLSKENTVTNKQLFKLKAALQNEDHDENIYMDSYVPYEFDNLNRRLMKELSNKEASLAEKIEQLQELKAEHDVVVDKFKNSEKQVLVCMDRLSELENLVDKATQLLSDKENEMACLQRDKLELQQCLQEARYELYNGREVLNASSDLLDTSQLHSSMNTTAENLATSVIDKQLREKEQENDQLREQLAINAQENIRNTEELLQVVLKYQMEIPTTSQDSQSQLVYLIQHTVDQLYVNWEQEQRRGKELQAQYNTLLNQNILQGDNIQNLKCEVGRLNQELAESNCYVLSNKENLQQHESVFKDKFARIRQELEKKDQELLQINKKYTEMCTLNRSLEARIITEMERLTQCNKEKLKLKHQMDIQSQEHNLEQIKIVQEPPTVNAKKIRTELELKANIDYSNLKRNETIQLKKELENILQEQYSIDINEIQIHLRQEAKKPSTSKDQGNEILLLEEKLEVTSRLCKQRLEQEHIEKELIAAKSMHTQLIIKIIISSTKINEYEKKQRLLEKQVESMHQMLQKQKHEQDQFFVVSKNQLRELQKQLQIELQLAKLRDEQLSDVRRLLVNEVKKCQLLENQKKQLETKYVAIEKDVKNTLAKREEELQKIQTQLSLTTKHLEKMTIKLSEQQAALFKKKCDVVQTKLGQDGQTELTHTLHENNNLQIELRQNKVRANRGEDKLISFDQQRIWEEPDCAAKHDQLIKLEKTCDNSENILCELEKEKVQLKFLSESMAVANDCNAEIVELVECTNMRHQLNVAKLQLSEALEELHSTRLTHESVQSELAEKIEELEEQREKAIEREGQYRRKFQNLKEELRECNSELTDVRNSRDEVLDTLHKTQEKITQHRAKAQQLELDCQILQAKYRDAKEEIGFFEQKLKDQRFEMEGKLEKMKMKMRTLYTAEVTRLKEKQERDMASSKTELEKRNAQSLKYEEHTRKLSNQIVRLNENILEQQKQYALLSTKLLHLNELDQATASSVATKELQPLKRPSASSANLGSNLAMEDEEGEVFNNTYLTDLKLCRVTDMTAEELQNRNLLQPPHLKSTYAAQYNLATQENYIKDGQLSQDDSMSMLLSITEANGVSIRKKSMGTHYKRPGPPTPSKNGGRLSFGSSEPTREILRETWDTIDTAKTPTRFKMFTSRFSMGSIGIGGGHSFISDEQSHHRRRNLLSGVQHRNLQLCSASSFCTSTPRKSRPYNDRPRMITQDDPSSGHQQKDTPLLSNAEKLIWTTTSSCSSAASVNNDTKEKHNRKEIPRISFCLHGNIFARRRTRSESTSNEHMTYQRSQQRCKMRQQRFGCFDQSRYFSKRVSECEKQEVTILQESSVGCALQNDNNNYSSHNQNHSLMVLNTTLLLGQRLNASATFNVPSASANVSCSYWTKKNQPSFLKALDATYDRNHDTCSILQQGFEEDDAITWLHPFALDSFKYNCSVLEIQNLNENGEPLPHYQPVNSINNIAATTIVSCTTNVSSLQSRTTHSLGLIQSHHLPQITITTVPGPSAVRETPYRINLWCHRMSFIQLLVLGTVSLILLTPFYSQFYDTSAVGNSLALLLLLSAYYFSSK